MKIGLRILFGYFLIVGLAAWFLLNVFAEEVKPGVRATLEDSLVDTANLLAELVASDMEGGTIDRSALAASMQALPLRLLDVNIGEFDKTSLDFRVYVTDDRGIVVFDSSGLAVGQDYSRWNDVYLTLRGKYGARTTRSDPADDKSSVMHIAAPIMDGERILGVLTVAKATAAVQPFVERGQQKILRQGAILLAASLLIGLAFAAWLSHSLRALQRYAHDVEAGNKAPLPRLGNDEIGVLGRALEAMRNRLEGKEYVEEVMHTFAHEMKSPIAAIQGSAELLREEMPAEQRERFLTNILEQNQRQKQLIDKLLALVRVEKQQSLPAVERFTAASLLDQVGADYATHLAEKDLRLSLYAEAREIEGDRLLLRQALGNLLDNAISFAPAGSTITFSAQQQGDQVQIAVCDAGLGIPDYAAERIFERFYSLPRADGARSTGLGLPFVREVALLHHGAATVRNLPDGGVCASVHLPAYPLHTQRIAASH